MVEKTNLKSEYYELTESYSNYRDGKKIVDVKENAKKFIKKLLKLGFNAVEVIEGKGALSTEYRLPTFTFQYDVPLSDTRIIVQITLRGKGSVNFSIYNSYNIITEDIADDELGYTLLKLDEANNTKANHDYSTNGLVINLVLDDDTDIDDQVEHAWNWYTTEIRDEVVRVGHNLANQYEAFNNCITSLGLYNKDDLNFLVTTEDKVEE